jgi:predicted nuclease of predicted toxin-antitoxin system
MIRILFDENLSRDLVTRLRDLTPNCLHPDTINLRGRPDAVLWDFAKTNGCLLISKDDDFRQRSLLLGHPPKVIWLAVGNATTAIIEQVIRSQWQRITRFVEKDAESLLIIR